MMYTTILPLITLVSLVSAQATPKSLSTASTPTPAAAPGTPICDGAPVLEACLSSTTMIAGSCSPADYQCLCEKWQAVAQCYNSAGCPNDPRLAGASSNQYAYCNNAALYSSKPAISKSAAVSPSTGSTGPIATHFSGSESGSGSASGISGSSSGIGSTGPGIKTTGRQGGAKTTTGSSSSSTESATANAAARSLIVGTRIWVVLIAGFIGAVI